jgi:hypothetical protein
MARRNGRGRRARNSHNSRRDIVHLHDQIRIDAAACKVALRDEKLDDMARLMLLVAISAGDTTMTFAELKAAICGEVLEAGGVKAAIRHREIILS